MLTKTVTTDKTEVVNTGLGYPVVQVRQVVLVEEDNAPISKTFHRYVLMPDADLSLEDADVQAIASLVFTDKAKAAYAAAKQETE